MGLAVRPLFYFELISREKENKKADFRNLSADRSGEDLQCGDRGSATRNVNQGRKHRIFTPLREDIHSR